jgi:hypothetical protein
VSDRYEIRKTPFCAYLYEGEECVASFNDAVKAGRIAAALNAQPQASAEDVALVGSCMKRWAPTVELAAWQRIRASLGVGK